MAGGSSITFIYGRICDKKKCCEECVFQQDGIRLVILSKDGRSSRDIKWAVLDRRHREANASGREHPYEQIGGDDQIGYPTLNRTTQ